MENAVGINGTADADDHRRNGKYITTREGKRMAGENE